MSIIGHLIGKSFDRRVRGRKTKREDIPYTVLLGAPDERKIRATTEKIAALAGITLPRKMRKASSTLTREPF